MHGLSNPHPCQQGEGGQPHCALGLFKAKISQCIRSLKPGNCCRTCYTPSCVAYTVASSTKAPWKSVLLNIRVIKVNKDINACTVLKLQLTFHLRVIEEVVEDTTMRFITGGNAKV